MHFGFDEEQTAEAIRLYRAHFHEHGLFKMSFIRASLSF